MALARTLVTEPRLLLLDEPLGALDANLRDRMMIELRNIHDQVGCTFVHVTGNEQEAIAMGTRVAMLIGGESRNTMRRKPVFANPASAAVARLLSCHNALAGEAADGIFAAGADPAAAAEQRPERRSGRLHDPHRPGECRRADRLGRRRDRG